MKQESVNRLILSRLVPISIQQAKNMAFITRKAFMKVPESGKVDVKIVATGVKLATDSLLDADGSALVIHEKADDYKTDPAGNAGNRIACAPIQEA
jgi:hypothetical protein